MREEEEEDEEEEEEEVSKRVSEKPSRAKLPPRGSGVFSAV